MNDSQKVLSSKLIELTGKLEALEPELKSAQAPDPALLRDFRRSVDDVRNTAWVLGELMNARQTGKNEQVVLSFVAAERMRRFGQMARGITSDIDQHGLSWESGVVQELFDSVATLQSRLSKLISQRKALESQARRS
ncbi:MAG TPA: hypothetical protein VJN64_07920 [Terriglobales bacterium]|nr:hypothetical protein [Terriglobales bacterium]